MITTETRTDATPPTITLKEVTDDEDLKKLARPQLQLQIQQPWSEHNKHKSDVDNNFSPLCRQLVVSFGIICASIAAGMTSGYSAVLLPQLQRNTTEIPITASDSTWIASIAALPMAVGCLLGGMLMERFGRKWTLLLLNVPFLAGWLLIGFANNLPLLLTGRFITGLCVGLLGPPSSVYIGEISAPQYRGFLLAAISLAIALGILIAHVLGTYLHWQFTALVCGFLPLLSAAIIGLCPESPSWLLAHGQQESAERAFVWLRGSDEAANDELRDLVEKQCNGTANRLSWKNVGTELKNPVFVRPLLIILTFFFVTQFAGVNAVAFYSVSIMQKTLGADGLDKYVATFVIDGVRLVMSVVGCVLLRRVGSRPLAIFSASGTALSLFGLSAYLFWTDNGGPSLAWLPLLLLVGYISFISIGIVPLPWCMTGELFPLSHRGLGSGLASAFNFIVFFVVVQTGPTFFTHIGPEGAFLVYGSVAFFGVIFLYLCLPETRNRTLQQIEDAFKVAK